MLTVSRLFGVGHLCGLGALVLVLTACNNQPVYRPIDPDPLVELAEPTPETAAYYQPDQIIEIATNLLLFQRHDGGWAGDRNPLRKLTLTESYILIPEKTRLDSTLAQGNTAMQIEYLAQVYMQTGDTRYRDGALRGLDFLLNSQYDNGGWPRSPSQTDSNYHRAITLEDEVMPGVLGFLTQVAAGQRPFGFISRQQRQKVAETVRRGNQLLLRLQLRRNDQRTGWAARYHPETLQPAEDSRWADTAVSVQVANYLMSVRRPNPGTITALQELHQWFASAALTDICISTERVAFADLAQPDPLNPLYQDPVWLAHYPLAPGKPVPEPPTFGLWPQSFIDHQYPAWRQRHSL